MPTAQVVSVAFIVVAALIMGYRHRPGHPLDDPPTHPEVATWGAIGRPVEVTPEAEPDDVDRSRRQEVDGEDAIDDEGQAIDDGLGGEDADGRATDPVRESEREPLGRIPGPSPG